jgi:hypothetical protein
MALPYPAAVLLLFDFAQETFFKARQVEMCGIAARQIVAAMSHPMPWWNFSQPEFVSQPMHAV